MLMRNIIYCLLIVVFGYVTIAVAAPDTKNPCSAPFWEEYTGDGMVSQLTVQLKASTIVTEKDTYFLKLLGEKDVALGYIKLVNPGEKGGLVVYDFAEPIPAAEIVQIELFSPKLDVHMTWMNVSGEVGGKDYQFFDHECTGVVIGPGGCKRMRVH